MKDAKFCASTPAPASLLVLLAGDIRNDPDARTKYGGLATALERHFEHTQVYDVSLKGWRRVYNALQVFHPNLRLWKQRFYKNLPAFRLRSQQAHRLRDRYPDWMALQIGVLFDASNLQVEYASLIYTDYTAALSARKAELGRSPFDQAQLNAWLEAEKQAYEDAAHVFTRSEYVRRSLVEDYDIDPDLVTAVGGGVNFDPLPVLEPKPAGAPTFLFIGKDFYRKGGDLTLQAFARLRAVHPEARLRMLTDGPAPADLPLDGVEVISPTWDRQVIETLYRQADVFVLPSRLETWGDVLLEAMAFGLPCVGVRGEAMDEIILDGQTGRVVPGEDIGALAAVMQDLVEKPAARQAWGNAGRARVEEHFTWARVVALMFEQLI